MASVTIKHGILLAIVATLFGCRTLPPGGGDGTDVAIRGEHWFIDDRITNEGSPAEGLLMNVRMVNAVFEDDRPSVEQLPSGFDPDENTARFIQRIPEYVAHGINAFTISLQGGFPGYEGAVNSAFDADGSLRQDYLNRVARVIDAADGAGAAVILTCFYQRQHSHRRALAGRDAVLNAVANVARWIRDSGFTNVVLEISNEYRHRGFSQWNDGEWLRSDTGQVRLIQHAKATTPRLLVSTSGMGNGRISDVVGEAADFVLIHFNTTPLEEIAERIRQARRFDKPIVCNEDDKIGEDGAEVARLSMAEGAGWGFMHSAKNQYVPFEFEGAADDPTVYGALKDFTAPGSVRP